jgi:putative two-component system response regulator
MSPRTADDDLKSAVILLVDDLVPNLRLLEKALQEDGYVHVVATSDARQALPLAKEAGADLVLLDLNMPYLSGHEVMVELATLPTPPAVLVLTAQTDRDNRLRALKAGARDYLTKPVDIVELLARVKNVIGSHLHQKEIQHHADLLEQRVRERTRELVDTRLDIIRRLGRAAEWRDNETGLHIIRMSKFSQILGLRAGLSESAADMLLNASPMHDIGKIGIPDRILLKPGKLDAEEWPVMQTHAAIGADLLDGNPTPLFIMARDIALTHHEKWDGSGYPHGLAGTAIPLVGRIVAIADVFDALTSERPYKKPWTIEAALAFMRDQSGKHFDPELVEHFLAAGDEIAPICEHYSDAHPQPMTQ